MKMKSWVAFIMLLMAPLLAMAWPSQQIVLSGTATNGGVVISWTAPTPPAGTTLMGLDVRYDTSPISALNWSSHPQVLWLTNPGTPGTVQTAVVTGLNTNTYYYFAIKAQCSNGSFSGISTTPSVVSGGLTYELGVGWTPSISTNVVAYNVYIGIASRVYVQKFSTGNVTSLTMTNYCLYGMKYYIAATAVDSSGIESPFSDEITFQRP